VTAIYKSASIGQIVQIPLKSDDPFYTKEGLLVNVPYFFEKSKSVESFTENTITLGRHLGKEGE
jgi:hypothetical protein